MWEIKLLCFQKHLNLQLIQYFSPTLEKTSAFIKRINLSLFLQADVNILAVWDVCVKSSR